MNAPRIHRSGHLDYYREHGIAPVRYDLSSMDAHLERRASLYNRLGLLPLALRGSRVLEVAAGTGHNSLYVAYRRPQRLVLLEPNSTAVVHIRQTYADFERPHTPPEIVTQTLEEFAPAERFDIVICENWLGTPDHEIALLHKLAALVEDDGLLVVTAISPIGFAPNMLRRFLVSQLIRHDMDFETRSRTLEAAFGSHLATLAAMTRSARDWVQDNMLNPAFFGLCLGIPRIIAELGGEFDVVGAYPAFAEDWRWFKSLHGRARRINEHFLDEYWRKAINQLDYRQPLEVIESAQAPRLSG